MPENVDPTEPRYRPGHTFRSLNELSVMNMDTRFTVHLVSMLHSESQRLVQFGVPTDQAEAESLRALARVIRKHLAAAGRPLDDDVVRVPLLDLPMREDRPRGCIHDGPSCARCRDAQRMRDLDSAGRAIEAGADPVDVLDELADDLAYTEASLHAEATVGTHSWCADHPEETFDSVNHFNEHLADVHGVPMPQASE